MVMHVKIFLCALVFVCVCVWLNMGLLLNFFLDETKGYDITTPSSPISNPKESSYVEA